MKNARIRPNGKIVLWGTATDNNEIKNIEIVFQNVATGKYFKSNNWHTNRQSFRVQTDESGDWEWVSPVLPKGNYVARIRAHDTAGNYETAPQIQKLEVVSTAE